MEGAEKDDKSEKESPPLKIDPECFQDAFRSSFQHIKTDDPRLDFYTVYKREATEYDTDYVKKYDEDLNTTLIFAGLFSAVSSAFVIDVHSKLQPDPNGQSAALLRAILLTLNQSAIPGETPVVPPAQGNPPGEIVTVTSLMYASLLMSLLVAFAAMLGKQWLNRYLRNSGGSMIERCGDRQRKCDGLEKWPLHLFVESLPVMLQVSLFLLACGLCRHMWSIDTSVAYTLIILTGLGGLFYIGVVIAGTSSYACPFQTPVSIALRNSWKRLRRGIVSFIVPFKRVLSWIHRMRNRTIQPPLRRTHLTIVLENILENIRVRPKPWLGPKDLVVLRTNTNDVRCVSWILRDITDSEALDAAVRLAGMIRWFEDGIDLEPPYDLIVSIFHTCFDSNGKVYPGSRDRAYYSGRAILWIRTLATCKSQETARRFPLMVASYTAPAPDHDLTHLFTVTKSRTAEFRLRYLLDTNPRCTPLHSQWISNVLLHHSWANRTTSDFGWIQREIHNTGETTIPLDVTLNRLLAWCICLGSPVEEGALKVRDKSDHLEQILRQLSKAIIPVINVTHPRRKLIPHVLHDLIGLKNRPMCLTEMTYEWCSVICGSKIEDWESLLLGSLEIGFRHRDLLEIGFRHRVPTTTGLRNPSDLGWWNEHSNLTHTMHHRGLATVVFKSRNSEAISDLLHAWTMGSRYHELLGICTGYLVDLHDLAPFSSRLRQLVMRSVELIGYKRFEEVGVEGFVELLNHLRAGVKDIDDRFRLKWISLLLDTIRSPKGAQCLPDQYWELLVQLTILESEGAKHATYSPQVTAFLLEAQEWVKLEYWVAIVWMAWPPETEETTEDLKRVMASLFHRRPGAFQKLTQWMQQRRSWKDVSEHFERICEQAHVAAQQGIPSTSLVDGAEDSARPPLPATSSSSRGSTS